MTFKELHNSEQPLLVCNVWDVASAKIAEQQGFQAIGTSSAAIAGMLGYEDGEEITFSELYSVVKRIKQQTKVFLSVDIESGYSREPQQIVENIKALASLGVAGINIEDSVVGQERTLIDTELFAERLSIVTQQLKHDGVDIFINVRTDVFLLASSDPKAKIKLKKDGWTVVTSDKKLSAQWEHTIAVTTTGYEVLTLRDEERESPEQ